MAIESSGKSNAQKGIRLVDAVREIKIAAAERNDVVVEMKEADRARIEILAQELESVFAEVPADDERFDFAISSGLQPRLWIDATAHVMMGKDRRQYRFVRDTRLGRVVLAESNKTEPVAAAITKYIGERIYERELAFAGDDVSYRAGIAQRISSDQPVGYEQLAEKNEQEKAAEPEGVTIMAAHDRASKTSMSPIGWLLIGLFVGGGALLLAYRDVIMPSLSN